MANQPESSSGPGTFNIPHNILENLIDDSKLPLYPGCTKFTKFAFLVRLLHLKVYNRWTNKSFDMLLQLLRDVIPNGECLPKTTYEANKYLKGLGMGCHYIHACKYDCCLFWKENEQLRECPVCGTSRYQDPYNTIGKPRPHKILRYFPLKPRLQRLYMSSKLAPLMRWHKDVHVDDGISMTHPADGEAWKNFDRLHPEFACDARNVRLGLASDGFNPFGSMTHSYSMWPVVLVTYNLPPLMCLKREFFIMSLLIPGPKAPKKEIDIYLKPLVDELHDLWVNGLLTYDYASKTNFNMRVALMWTINDFSAYGNLSGWSTKGYMACPVCNKYTPCVGLGRKIAYIGHRCYLPLEH